MTTTYRRHRTLRPGLVLVGIATVLSVTLSACASSSTSSGDRSTVPAKAAQTSSVAAAPPKGAYDFTPNAQNTSDTELTIQLPKSLMDQMPDRVPYITKAVAKARPWKKLGDCAIDVEFTFNPAISQAQLAKAFKRPEAGEITGNPMALSNWKPLSELNDSSPRGEYLSEDFKHLTGVRQCAVSPADTDSSPVLAFNFLVFDKTINDSLTMADIDLMTTKAGTVIIKPSGLNGWQMDYQGNWARK